MKQSQGPILLRKRKVGVKHVDVTLAQEVPPDWRKQEKHGSRLHLLIICSGCLFTSTLKKMYAQLLSFPKQCFSLCCATMDHQRTMKIMQRNRGEKGKHRKPTEHGNFQERTNQDINRASKHHPLSIVPAISSNGRSAHNPIKITQKDIDIQ